jgi:hypothetical protein
MSNDRNWPNPHDYTPNAFRHDTAAHNERSTAGCGDPKLGAGASRHAPFSVLACHEDSDNRKNLVKGENRCSNNTICVVFSNLNRWR